MRVVPRRPPPLRRWILRGALAGLAVGAAAFAIGSFVNWRSDTTEFLEGMALLLLLPTMPVSLVFIAVADSGALPHTMLGLQTDYLFPFIVLPLAQGVIVALLLWSLSRLFRWRAD